MDWISLSTEQKNCLIKLYSLGKENRHYHNLIHASLVSDTIKMLNEVVGFENYLECSIAAWFHDCVYYPGALDNEKKSAQEAEKFILEFNIDIDAKYVSYLIGLTSNHKNPKNEDEAMFLDADLQILAAPKFKFNVYESQIWNEYSSVVDYETFCLGRYKFLTDLMNEKYIFHSEFGRTKWENNARVNINESIKKLSKQIKNFNLC